MGEEEAGEMGEEEAGDARETEEEAEEEGEMEDGVEWLVVDTDGLGIEGVLGGASWEESGGVRPV